MEEKITLCGDDCASCPRYNAHSPAELRAAAELWHRIGWRDSVVPDDEIACGGCSAQKACTYGLVECTGRHGVETCSRCKEFPCGTIAEMLERSKAYQKQCKELCSPEEYRTLQKAFFNKEQNLRK